MKPSIIKGTHWINQAPEKQQPLRVLVIVEERELKPSYLPQNSPNPSNKMIISEYKNQLTEEQIALFSKLMGAYSLTDSATTNPYDYPS